MKVYYSKEDNAILSEDEARENIDWQIETEKLYEDYLLDNYTAGEIFKMLPEDVRYDIWDKCVEIVTNDDYIVRDFDE